jgi:putative membrane protein
MAPTGVRARVLAPGGPTGYRARVPDHRAPHSRRRPIRPAIGVLIVSLALAPACGGRRTPPAGSSTPPTSGNVAAAMTPLPDANTAALLVASHDAAVAAARIAGSRAQHRDVKRLARDILTDHTSLGTSLRRLLESSSLATRDDDVSRLLREQAAARRDTLRTLSGARFDSAYVSHEVRFHQDLLVAIDEVFLPSVSSAPLRQHVDSLRSTVASHLTLARQAQATLAARR